jgi:hypothetical protein
MEHPDFSPDPILAPRVLFAESRRAFRNGRTGSFSDEDDFEIKPKKLFAQSRDRQRNTDSTSSSSSGAGRPGLGRTGSEVQRMALGPKRGFGHG